MPYLRAIFTDATARASNLSAVSTLVPDCLHGDVGRDHAVEQTMGVTCEGPSMGSRLPSQRPIDHRWDASRGLVFSLPQRSAVNNQTWSPGASIRFSSDERAQRRYGTRPIGTRSQTSQSATKPVYGSALADLSGRPQPTNQAFKGSKQEQMEMDLKAKDQEIVSLKADCASAKKQFQESVEKIKGLEYQMERDKEKFLRKGREDEAAANAKAMALITHSLDNVEASRDLALKDVQSLQEQLDRERSEWDDSVKALKGILREEKLRYLHDQRDRENKHAKELQDAKESLRERKEQRKDYNSYRQIFDKVHDERSMFRESILHPITQADKALSTSKSLAKALQNFCAKHPGTADFSKQLQQFGEGRRELLGEQLESIRGMRSALTEADASLKGAAHESRLLSQHLRFSPDTEPAATLDAAYRALLEQPFMSTVERYEREAKELEQQIEQSTSETVREELKSLVEATTAKKHPFLHMRSLAATERKIQVLEARQRSSYVEKAVYVGSLQLREARDEINKSWYDDIDAAREGASTSGVALKRISEYRHLTHDVANDIEKLEPATRKKAQLMEALERSEADLPRLDAFVDRRLSDARAKLNGLFEQYLGIVRGTRGMGKRLRAVSAPALRVRHSPIDSRQTAFAPRKQNSTRTLDDAIRRLRDPSASPSKKQRQAASSEEQKLVLQKLEINIASVTRKRAQLADSDPVSQTMDREIENVTKARDRIRSAAGVKEPAGSTPTSSAQAAAFQTRRVRITKPSSSRMSGVRRFSTSTRPSGYGLGFYRHMHSTSAPVADPVFYDLDQPALSKHTPPRVNTSTTSTAGSSASPVVNNGPHTLTPDDAGSAAASEWSVATSAVPEGVSETAQETTEPSVHETASDTTGQAAMGTTLSSPEELQMSFQIPPADFRSAVTASQLSSAAFWKYSMYRDSDGNKPTLHYCTNYEQTEAQAAKFLNEEVIGFDLEWEIGAHPGKAPNKRCVSLVQIAAEDKIGLFHISLFKGNNPAELISPSLRRLLESPDIIKTGVNIGGDATRMEKCFGVAMHGLFELSHLYKVVTFSDRPEKINKVNFKLASQVQNVLHLPLAKGEVRTSAWSKRLDLKQTEYAASDAYAGLRLFDALERKRKLMDPMPPRPAFYELKMPLVLGNGHVVVPKTRVMKGTKNDEVKVAEVVEDEEDSKEFFDAPEEQDADEAISEAAVTESDETTIAYPELPRLEDLSLSDKPAVPEQTTVDTNASTKTSSISTASTTQITSPEKADAEQWATTFRESCETEGRKPVATPSNLRAYYLWHHQGYDVKRTANLLKDPPLASATVITYILEAVTRENLDFDVERMTEVIDCMPKSVWWRYAAVAEKVEEARSSGK